MHGVLGTVCSVLRYARRAVVQTSIAFRQAAELVVEWAAEAVAGGLEPGFTAKEPVWDRVVAVRMSTTITMTMIIHITSETVAPVLLRERAYENCYSS